MAIASRITQRAYETLYENDQKQEVNVNRQKVLRQMSDNVTTEDLVMIHEFFPHLMECALHEILNPQEVVQ